MRERTCCFSGHRDIASSERSMVVRNTYIQAETLIRKGVIYFGTGGARGFDTIAAQTVLKLKQVYPQIRLILVLPCLEQTKHWNEKDRIIYDSIKQQADKVRILSPHYYDGCMQVRNRHLVEHSAYLICYKRKNYGGTAYTVAYAEKCGLTVIRI